ncbi:MAG: radical SAM protein [Thermodesulfobacteriota bacterium]|nr:radical SAM protein [Thermodesulfobacteriota bacterium]
MDLSNHPCFNTKACGKFGRVHLPVAPRCNIQCKYCDRKYDCVNESRPGVTGALLTPHQAMTYLEFVFEKTRNISVVGIAGPGDPFANPEETMQTLSMARGKYPDIMLCLATNGLGIEPYVDELAELGISHVSITLNAIDHEIGAKIYSFVRHGKRTLGPKTGIKILLEKQLEAIEKLKKRGIITKVNTIILPGINEDHIEAVAKKMGEMKVDILNCVPFYPNKGAAFENLGEPSKELVKKIREKAAQYLPQMHHCARCRADAIGIIGEENNAELVQKMEEYSQLPEIYDEKRPYVAVATLEGALVNQNLGKARELFIYGKKEGEITFIESRKTPEPGQGMQRWEKLAEIISDCRALLVHGIGNNPREMISRKGIDILELDGMIDEAVEAVFEGHSMNYMIRRDVDACNRPYEGTGCM